MSAQPTEPLQIEFYRDNRNRFPVREWLDGLDLSIQMPVLKRLARLETGNPGDSKGLGDGVCEMRLTLGPGIRIYFGRDGKRLVVLLAGGDKKSQAKDIETAKMRWQTYLEAKRSQPPKEES